MTRGLLALLIALVGVLSLACDDGDAGRPTARATAAFSPVTPAAGLPCKPPKDVKSYRYTWRFKMETPRSAEALEDLEASVGPPPGDAQEDPLVELGAAIGLSLLAGAADIWADAAFVLPDRYEARISAGDLEYRLIGIGEEAWVKVGAGDWQELATHTEDVASPDSLAEMCKGFEAVFPEFGGSDPDEPDETPDAVVTPDLPQVAGIEAREERVNGVDAIHYRAELTDIEDILGYLGIPVDDFQALGELGDVRYDLAKMTFDWWLAKDGNWPVRMEFAFRGQDDEGRDTIEYGLLEVKDLNDPDIKIEPPIEND